MEPIGSHDEHMKDIVEACKRFPDETYTRLGLFVQEIQKGIESQQKFTTAQERYHVEGDEKDVLGFELGRDMMTSVVGVIKTDLVTRGVALELLLTIEKSVREGKLSTKDFMRV